MPPLVEFEVFRDYLGVGATDPLVDDVSRLLAALGVAVRRGARRAFEGDEGGSYDQVIRIRGVREFILPHVPVRAITSIAPAYFDGTVGDVYATTDYRLEDADRGAIRLRYGPEYVRVIWTTTGDIPASIPQAVLEWGKARWDDRERNPGLASYETGDDAESYFASLAGKPPHDVLLAILGARHATGGGVV